jgi:hypothetical protein
MRRRAGSWAVWAIATLALTAGCATIPRGRYGVADVEIQGLTRLDEAALRACLGTRERAQFGLDFGSPTPSACGEPPFDSRRWRVDFFSWPWTEWPLFDASVFDRDVQRVERWLRARGHYEGRVLAAEVEPQEALGERAPQGAQAGRDPSAPCVADATRGCEVRVRFLVEEGSPVRVARITIRGEHPLDPELRRRLRGVLRVHRADVFDEARFDETRRAMQRVLANGGYPDAQVAGDVKINAQRREAYLLFRIEPGSPGVFGRICVRGHGELPPRPILAATYLEPGQTFSLDAIEEAQRAIFQLGTLSSVEISYEASYEDPTEDALEDAEAGREDTPDPGRDADAARGPSDEEEPGAERVPERGAPSETPYCTEAPTHVPEGTRVVDLRIQVSPGRLERIGLGIGVLAGDTLGFGTQSASSGTSAFNAQVQQQWDIHLLWMTEWRNLFGDMLRVRIEERPRLIFPAPFPGVESETGLGPSLGNRIVATVRWPAFLEPRTALFGALSHDYGPIPLYGFFRHELDARIGLERTFLDGRLYLSGAIRGNLFLPDQEQDLRVTSQRETTRAFFFEQIANLDLRDNPRNPTQGAFFSVGLQEAGVAGISSWDYFRIVADARGYVPLGLGIVLALRFGIGAMFIGGRYGLDPDNIYALYHLGPLSQQLQGGGAVSNRGFPPGLLGDVERRRAQARPRPGDTGRALPPVIVSGGIRRWEGSLELRVPITTGLGIVAFADVGNVSRSENFGFEFLQFAFGIGLRYRTMVGPLRLDIAFRPDDLQYVGGGDDPRLRACADDRDFDCRPVPDVNLGVVRFPGAIHLTIGEAF